MLQRGKLLAALLAALLLCACVKSETTDLVSFCRNTETKETPALRLTDCLLDREDGELRCFWRVEDGLSLRLICTEEGKVTQCRVILRRLQPDGTAFPVTAARTAAFCALAERACAALEEISPEEGEAMFQALHLRSAAALSQPETSPLFRGAGFFARLVGSDAQAVLELSNKWLCPQEEKETPESVPAFDATTNIRTETVPLS